MDGAAQLEPSTAYGDDADVLTPLAVDAVLNDFRWKFLVLDLPALDPSRLATGDQTLLMINALRHDRALE